MAPDPAPKVFPELTGRRIVVAPPGRGLEAFARAVPAYPNADIVAAYESAYIDAGDHFYVFDEAWLRGPGLLPLTRVGP